MALQPTGTVTLLFTDIEGSTGLLERLGRDQYAAALDLHRDLLRNAFEAYGGYEVDFAGDAFFVAFSTAEDAVAAAAEAQRALAGADWPEGQELQVRMGIHTGEPLVVSPKYVGMDVHTAARIMAAGHGGQVVLSQTTRDLVGDTVGVRDLGEHRLKDFSEPVWIFQLGSSRFPPLKTISNTNLPRPASSFVGREKEVGEVVSLLRDGARLLTVTGPGGSGKTRLALEAAAELVPEFKAGVFWVGLAPLRDPSLVGTTIAQTLGARNGLAEYVRERELLLLLDNLEQVVGAAPELAALVEACPNLRLLMTSRELLRVRGEVEYAVLPLAEPEAVELFCARAGALPDETVHSLCRALDNLPLALELAAARASVLSPKQILERLFKRLDLLKGGRDANPRQQTLRATIDWSYDLLDEHEARLFARLAVFAGGCTLESAEQVADADLDALQSLVDQSLLRHAGERFWMLETVREYAAERLEASGEAEQLERRHAQHFLALAEEADPNLRGSPKKEWLERLARDHDNLRAALDRLEAAGESELGLRLAGALQRFWYLRGHLAEGRRRLEGALRNNERPTAARAKALNGASALAVAGGDGATARLRAEQGLALHRGFGDAWGIAQSGVYLACAAVEEADLPQARQLFEESVRRFRELGDEHSALLASTTLAETYEDLGDRERARALNEETLRRARALPNQRVEAMSLAGLADIAIDEGRIEEALSMLKESLRILVDLGQLYEMSWVLCLFARVLAVEGRAGTAARLLSCSEAHRATIGGMSPYLARRDERTLTTIRTQLDDAAFAQAWEQGQALTLDEAVALALASPG